MRLKIGVVGATGIVGSEVVSIVNERKIPVQQLRLFASEKSEGKRVTFDNESFIVEKIEKEKLYDLDYLFFCSSEDVSKEFIPIASARGICCIDNSSAFREQVDVPLVVPEINPHALLQHKNIIANPNCSTILAMMALFPLHQTFTLRRFCSATYQAVSGVGLSGMAALEQDTIGNFSLSEEVFGEQILCNAIPKIGGFFANGYTSEEMKMLNESRKILSLPKLKVSSTCVRISVIRAHSIAIIAEFEKTFDLSLAEKVLSSCRHIDFFQATTFPSPIRQSNKDNVGVGRLRNDTCMDNAASMWIVGDQIRKGAALNAVQIMEHIERQKNPHHK